MVFEPFLLDLRPPSFWCQFHQHFMRAFGTNILAKKITKLCFGFEIFSAKILAKNVRVKC